MNNKLIINDLSFKRKGVFLFNDINFSLNSGEVLFIKGLNGVGKSTMVDIISGLINNNIYGSIYWNNILIRNNYEWKWFQNKINYFNPKHPLNEHLSIKENLSYWQNLYGFTDIDLKYYLEYFGLYSLIDTPVKFLSVGQTNKVSLIRFICNLRPIWIIDEPTLGLDKYSIELLTNLIKKHQEDGGVVILISHTDLFFKNVKYLYL